MSAFDVLEKVVRAADMAGDAITVAKGIVDSIRARRWDLVDEILEGPLKTELAMAAAEAKARAKFASGDDDA